MDRLKIIKKYVKDKVVLDLGSVGYDRRIKPIDIIRKYAKDYRGLDAQSCSDPKIYVGDVQRFWLGQQFDVIVGGDVIEHITDVKGFLGCCRHHLKDGGYLIITTPNVISRWVFEKNTLHTQWYDVFSLRNTLLKEGWIINKIIKYDGNKVLSFPLQQLRKIFYGVYPYLREGLLVVAKK